MNCPFCQQLFMVFLIPLSWHFVPARRRCRHTLRKRGHYLPRDHRPRHVGRRPLSGRVGFGEPVCLREQVTGLGCVWSQTELGGRQENIARVASRGPESTKQNGCMELQNNNKKVTLQRFPRVSCFNSQDLHHGLERAPKTLVVREAQ